jgi:hypothetical protein
MLLAGALSHLSTAGFFLAGGLTGGDLQGRATHVAVFASALQAIGVQPLTLFTVGSASPLAVSFLAALGGAVTAASGIVRWRGEPVVLGTLLTFLGFELYLRVMRPFPYGEFKLLTTVWPLLPALVVVGASALRARWPALAPLWVACVVLFGAGLTLTHWHVRSGLAEPWGAALPEREMDALRHVTSRVPSGAAVWVSNQLVPEAAMRWAGVETQARHGYASREAGASALAQRWRGAATALPSPIAHPTYGLVERHSTELRNPIEPASADFLLLDESEDPLFFGLTETALQGAAGRLRLYRGAGGASLPPAPLPIGESLPGRRQGFGLLRRAPAAPAVSGLSYSAHALWAGAETEVRLAGSAGERRVALFPGITWFISVDSTLQLAPTDATETQALTRRTLRPGAWTRGEQLERSRAGILAPGVLVSEGEADLTVHYVNLSASLVSTAARPQRSATIWLAGQPAGMQVLLDPPLTSARVPASTRWLEIGPEGRAALHAPAGVGLFSLPLVGGPAESPTLTNGDLVKGSSARLHLVQDGRLHWVPTLEALRRLGSIPRVITLRDEDLWRLAVGLPLE